MFSHEDCLSIGNDDSGVYVFCFNEGIAGRTRMNVFAFRGWIALGADRLVVPPQNASKEESVIYPRVK